MTAAILQPAFVCRPTGAEHPVQSAVLNPAPAIPNCMRCPLMVACCWPPCRVELPRPVFC